MKTKLSLQILVPILLVAMIGGIWLVKSMPKTGQTATTTGPVEPGTVAPGDSLAGADFSLNATEQIDFATLSQYGLPIIADYGATSCIPCKQMAPVLEKLNAEMQGKAFIKFVDVWKYSDADANVPVFLLPTQVLFNADGTPFVPSKALQTQLNFKMEYDRAGNHTFTLHLGALTEQQMRQILAEMGVE